MTTLCPCCGPDMSVDEDGCCATCGADATGPGVETVSRMIDCARQAQFTAEREHVASLASLAVEMAALREERDAALRVGAQPVRTACDDCLADRDRLVKLVEDAVPLVEWIRREGRYDMHESSLETQAIDWLARAGKGGKI